MWLLGLLFCAGYIYALCYNISGEVKALDRYAASELKRKRKTEKG